MKGLRDPPRPLSQARVPAARPHTAPRRALLPPSVPPSLPRLRPSFPSSPLPPSLPPLLILSSSSPLQPSFSQLSQFTPSISTSPPLFSLCPHKTKHSPVRSPGRPTLWPFWFGQNDQFITVARSRPFSSPVPQTPATKRRRLTFAGRRHPRPVPRGTARQSCRAVERPSFRAGEHAHRAERRRPAAAHVGQLGDVQARTLHLCKRAAHGQKLGSAPGTAKTGRRVGSRRN